MGDIREKNILSANILFLLLGFILFYFGSFVQSREIYSGLLITEYIIILLPNLIYLKLKGLSLKKVLRLNKINGKQILYIVLITIFSYPVAVFLNNLMLFILSFFGETIPNVVPLPDSPKLYLISLLVFGISPGICEEVMFRGTVMNAYRGLGKKKAIIFSALLFGLFHLNLQNLAGPIFLGLIFGIVVYKTNSIYSSILGHTLNNGIAMTLGYFAMKAQEGIDEVPAFEIPYRLQLLISLVVIGIIAFISLMILIKLLKKLPESDKLEVEETNYISLKLIDFLPILIGTIFFLYLNIKYVFI